MEDWIGSTYPDVKDCTGMTIDKLDIAVVSKVAEICLSSYFCMDEKLVVN